MTLDDLRRRGSVGSEVAGAIIRAVLPYDDRSYVLTIADDPDPAVLKGWRIELRDQSPQANRARIVMSFSESGGPVWVTIGKGLDIELPTGTARGAWKPLGLETLEEDVHALVNAVLTGAIDETVFRDDAGPFESRGSVTIRGRPIRVGTSYGGPGRTGPRVQETLVYAPYPLK